MLYIKSKIYLKYYHVVIFSVLLVFPSLAFSGFSVGRPYDPAVYEEAKQKEAERVATVEREARERLLRLQQEAAEAARIREEEIKKSKEEAKARIAEQKKLENLRQTAEKEQSSAYAKLKEAEKIRAELDQKIAEYKTNNDLLQKEHSAQDTLKITLEKQNSELQIRQMYLENRERIFSASVFGLLLTNIISILFFVANRKNRRLELENMALESQFIALQIEHKELELMRLRKEKYTSKYNDK